MATKKTLYRPAPELLDHSTTNLTQGNPTTVKTMKIKQGVLESCTRSSGKRRLTSTLKSTKTNVERRNPVVVCHDPRLVHSQIKSTGNLENVTTTSTTSPTVVNINKDSNKDKSMVKSKMKQSDFASGSLNEEKLQKTSTPTLKHRSDWFCNESAIAKHDSTLTGRNEEQVIGNSYLTQSNLADIDDSAVLYCRYLQAKHLELMAQNNRTKKAERASCVLSFLHDKNSRLDQELATLEDEVSELQHLYDLKCKVEHQKHALAPSVDKLSHALEQYRTLCKNLDTTTHHMPLIDIHNPDAAEMEKALDESRILIGQVNILLKSKMPEIQQAAEAMKNMSLTCEQEATNIPLVQNSAADMTSHVMEFGSLVAQLASYSNS